MFDGVINHASVQGRWFQDFLRDINPWREYFLTVEGHPDLSHVVRPRALPLLTEFPTASGKRRVWTTFSADQADLDYHNPQVLLEIFDILLMYAKRGAQFIRLDAIALSLEGNWQPVYSLTANARHRPAAAGCSG